MILRGFGVGALGGLLAFIFARIMSEPLIQRAIDYEAGRDAAQALLDKAAGIAVDPAGADLISRSVQRNVGIGVGMILFGLAIGGLFAVAYILVRRRVGDRIRPRNLAALLAAAGCVAIFLVPFLKYPANPPAVGHAETIGARSALYVAMVVISLAALIGAVLLATRLARQIGGWNASILAGGAYVALMAIVMLILPPLGHLDYNVANYGRLATETPQPLLAPDGTIVFPGFPADLLFEFRLYSVVSQLIIWTTIGLAFGALAERLLARAPARREVTGVAPAAG